MGFGFITPHPVAASGSLSTNPSMNKQMKIQLACLAGICAIIGCTSKAEEKTKDWNIIPVVTNINVPIQQVVTYRTITLSGTVQRIWFSNTIDGKFYTNDGVMTPQIEIHSVTNQATNIFSR